MSDDTTDQPHVLMKWEDPRTCCLVRVVAVPMHGSAREGACAHYANLIAERATGRDGMGERTWTAVDDVDAAQLIEIALYNFWRTRNALPGAGNP